MPKKAEVTREREVATQKVARSAKTGRTVSKAEAAADPDGTVVQTQKSPLEEFLTKFKLSAPPKTDAAKADLLYTTREDRLRLQKIVDQMEAREKELRAYFIENLSKKDSTGVAGKRARVQIVTEEQPQVNDWDEFYKHVKKKGEFDLLNRAINRTAVKARWDANKQIPGVGAFTVAKVSVTKVN